VEICTMTDPLSPELTDELDLALQAVRAHPRHILAPGYRWQIGARMGPAVRGSRPWSSIGHRRRAQLALAAARRVLPLWQARWPGFPGPAETLTAASDYLDGRRDAAACWLIGGRTREVVNEVIPEAFALSYAGESALLALRTAIDDEHVDVGTRDLEARDAQSGGDDNDAASAAVVAVAGLPEDDAGTDGASRRLAFWEWWLGAAVPGAYAAGSRLSGGADLP
jgi:hypothetical protein